MPATLIITREIIYRGFICIRPQPRFLVPCASFLVPSPAAGGKGMAGAAVTLVGITTARWHRWPPALAGCCVGPREGWRSCLDRHEMALATDRRQHGGIRVQPVVGTLINSVRNVPSESGRIYAWNRLLLFIPGSFFPLFFCNSIITGANQSALMNMNELHSIPASIDRMWNCFD